MAVVDDRRVHALLHDRVLIRLSEHLAERLARQGSDLPHQIATLYQCVLLRAPSSEESARLVEYCSNHGLANACRVLLNSNEFLYVD